MSVSIIFRIYLDRVTAVRLVALFLYVCSLLFFPPSLFFIVHLLSQWLPLSPGNKEFVGSVLLGVCLGPLQVLCRFPEDNRLL